MSKKIGIIIIIFIIIIGVVINKSFGVSKLHNLKIGNTEIKYELAKTPEEIEFGLSYRKDLPDGQGMLFVFPQKGFRSFWMREMLFPLDMIWIADETVVQIDSNVPIKTNGAWTVVNPNYPVDKVLEIKGGEAERLKIKSGNYVKIISNIGNMLPG